MVEGESKEVSEDLLMEALKIAHDAIKTQCTAQIELADLIEKSKVKREYPKEVTDEELKAKIEEATADKIREVAAAGIADKSIRKEKFEAIKTEFIESLDEEYADEKAFLIKKYFHDVQKKQIRNVVLDKRTRLDGRKLDEIRPIWSEVSYLPRVHGSAIFTRGETQSLTSITLGSKLDEQIIDGAVIEGKSKLLLHYNFPPFSTGEAKFLRGVSRREVGHGNLALRALRYMIPTGEENPYTIRIVSDILESNGSSSMATVCAGSMALMDAGVKMKKAVSGIAMGLIADTETGKYAVLSDILGDEDHLGDMDFKITGTKDGITACQMDIKVDGLSYEVLAEALSQAKRGRMHILEKMAETISSPREDYKDFVPRIEKMIINKDKIGAVIGSGGKVIQELQALTKTEITIEEVDEKGIIEIMSPNGEALADAKRRIEEIIAEPEIGKTYTAKVKSIMPYGAFVEYMPGHEGLLHVSEIDWARVENVEDVLKEGDEITVKLTAIDERSGKVKLSRKETLPKPEGYVERPQSDRRDDRRDDRRRDPRKGGGNNRRNDNRNRRDNR
jgi:polyribonucleotide nucleotidyltransferase